MNSRNLMASVSPAFTIGLAAIWLGTAAFGDERATVDFNTQIRPIFTRHCSACHGGVKQAGDVSFVYPEQVLPPDGWIVEPGDPESSVLIQRVKTDDPDLRMPPPDEHPEPLSDDAVQLLERWVAQGAEWGDHWSLAALADRASDAGGDEEESEPSSRWARQPLDHLVEARLIDHRLSPSADAEPSQWLRRASLDLTGLPPTPEQTAALNRRCASATTPAQVDAIYAAEVDRLLASQHFGERWASVWMDLARYADSKGYEKDPHRDMWPYRDWLIRAFNIDMPYDQFTIKQLAGDLLENPTADDLVATAFHRNTQTNTEGGTDDEEFRVAAVVDRVNTTWTVWQATTFGCVQCHSHPYDPLRQEEYYAFMALLNDTQDTDLDSDFPTLTIPAQSEQWESAVEKQLHYQSLRHDRNRIGRDLADQIDWVPLVPTKATSTSGQLRIDGDRVRSAGGTFPPGVSYTLEAAAVPMTALRIEIYPHSDNPADWPEQGSVLSHLKMSLVNPDGVVTPIDLADAFADAVSGSSDPPACLNEKDPQGVGGYPKLYRPRWAVIVLKDRLQVSDQSMLQLQMLQSANVTGNLATPLRHFRLQTCDDDRWQELLASDRLVQLTQRLADAKRAAGAIEGARLPVMLPRAAEISRVTRRFIRGNWMERGDPVSPGIPQLFARKGKDQPIEVTNRLQLARWLVSDANPLAARVWANRIWAQLFGIGLVETLEDFGSSGQQPSHPPLLDHLAFRLREVHRWRLKPLLREIVLSSTYRQTNHAPAWLREKDPRNRLLARGPRTRLSAEMVRDQALAVSGLLCDQMGGPSVMPPQPDGVWQTVYSGAKWTTSPAPQRYRRALYTYWRRTSPYPSFLTFDSPTRDLCAARRIATNTPLQALVTMNDPVYVQCAGGLVERAMEHAAPADVIQWMYGAVTQQQASPSDWKELSSLYADLRVDSAEDESQIDEAAMTIVANTILNLDRALTK